MGKSKGDGGRSKSRPSSSSLAASLLPSGASNIGFGGYLGSSRVESTYSSEDAGIPPDVDGEMAQHLKRLGRKDPTTKVKALTSLNVLFKQASGEGLVMIIPKWAFEYRKLLYDYSREVRRATHEAMASLVSTIGRGLAPHLKCLMGPWWFSQFDPISEVSQAARRSLEAAFPIQEKRLDALVLCANEVLQYLDENLRLTPEELLEKSIPADELDEMHQHVISSSLLSIATLMDVLLGGKLQSDDCDSSQNPKIGLKGAAKARMIVISCTEKIFSTHKSFQQFFKSKSPRVRSATYAAIGSYIKHNPNVFTEQQIKRLSTTVLSAFQEKDASCHSSMWDMILLFLRKFPDCWFYGSTQKSFLSHFWQFLRNGCYGSQEVSCPILIIFLDSLPSKAVTEEFFLLNFFRNLWIGGKPHSSSDQAAFFEAFKQCFLWGLFNAPICLADENSIHHFQVNLIEEILVMLLWHDYLLLERKGKKCDLSISNKDDIRMNYPMNYVEQMARCIIRILSNVSSRKSNLLDVFCTPFQNDCLDILLEKENLQKSLVQMERIDKFLLVLDQYSVQKNETWSLDFMAGPLFAKLFPSIVSLDSADAVKLLHRMVEIFGPRTMVSHLVSCNERGSKAMNESFLLWFEEDFVPWCFGKHVQSTSSKIDLLIALLDDELFPAQWSLIIAHAGKIEEHPGSNNVIVLTMLMNKVREKIVNKNMKIKCQDKGVHPGLWQRDLLDSAVVCVAYRSPPISESDAHFICAVLGGSSDEDQTCFLSRETVHLVFKGVLKNLVAFLSTSSLNWVKSACFLLLPGGMLDLTQNCELQLASSLEMAQFAFNILVGSIYCLKEFDDGSGVLPSILAALFIIRWECHITSELLEDHIESECRTEMDHVKSSIGNLYTEHMDAKATFGKIINDFLMQISISFLKSLDSSNQAKLEDVLIQTIRSAVFETDASNEDKTTMFCKWVLDLFDLICKNSNEMQHIVTRLLSEANFWPSWVSAFGSGKSTLCQSGNPIIYSHDLRHKNFTAFVSKLVLNLGVDNVIAGTAPQSHPFATDLTSGLSVSSNSLSRPWVAAELLCTWKWQGGNAAESFLPLLNEYAKHEESPEEGIIYNVVTILIDGAINHGDPSQQIFLNPWILTDHEVESIEEPFLRALVSLLLSLFTKDNPWTEEEAFLLFEYTIDKLFLGVHINLSCLKVFPFVLNVIIQQLLARNSEPDESKRPTSNAESMHHYILDWLERAIRLQSSSLTEAGQNDFCDWVQMVMSCFPLSITREVKSVKVERAVSVNNLEQTSLLSLFREQRCSLEVNSSIRAQMMLATLTAVSVAYCWEEFDEGDWESVSAQLQRWMNSTVITMEEAAETVDAAVVPNGVVEDVLRKLDLAVKIVDPLQMNITRIGIVIYWLVGQLVEARKVTDTVVLPSITNEKWELLKDSLLEHMLRIFFSTGAMEAIAVTYGEEASCVITLSRLQYSHFWELLGFCVIHSPQHIRTSAVQSMELWGLSKGPVAALYAILFSSKPISSLQLAAFHILSSEPICHLSVLKESSKHEKFQSEHGSHLLPDIGSSIDEYICLRDEITCIIEKPAPELLKMSLVLQNRVNVFLSWALLLSHLQSLPSSQLKEKLVQRIQDSASPIILDFVFQHILLKPGSIHNLKKKDAELPLETLKAANAAKHAINTCSLLFVIESLWPVGTEQMASLAGSIYGLMIRLLPAYVRTWFASLRDRSLSQAIESFTKVWCSPPLFSEELSQIREAAFADDNFSVTVSKSSLEIIASYKKEETGMDLVIRLPGCYPLKPVDVDCTRSLGVSEVKQRKWLLSLTAFVCNQNGAIAEAIRTWKNNLDREFEGVEECPICYSIIHTTDHRLPRLACKTCKHKFHSACLYKWFSTSHKSTCPLCQTPF